jgi:hypothetical protein
MIVTKKKITILALAVVSALCMAFGSLLFTPDTVKADDTEQSIYAGYVKETVYQGYNLINSYITIDSTVNYSGLKSKTEGLTLHIGENGESLTLKYNENTFNIKCLNSDSAQVDGFFAYHIKAKEYVNGENKYELKSFIIDAGIDADGQAVSLIPGASVSGVKMIHAKTVDIETVETTLVKPGDKLINRYVMVDLSKDYSDVNCLHFSIGFPVPVCFTAEPVFISAIWYSVQTTEPYFINNKTYKDDGYAIFYFNSYQYEDYEDYDGDGYSDVFTFNDIDYNGYGWSESYANELGYELEDATRINESLDGFYLLSFADDVEEENPDIPVDGEEPDTEEKDLFDKIENGLNNLTEWFNENTGLGVSSSIMGLAIVVVVVMLIRKRK